ncbi:hypothetical protein L4C36_18765 [Photobacterium japonica]|uniref:hypothetical protein n=1 Tax=Photobacterium japonica TaxID=2910235 RepID=UPI003D0FE44A
MPLNDRTIGFAVGGSFWVQQFSEPPIPILTPIAFYEGAVYANQRAIEPVVGGYSEKVIGYASVWFWSTFKNSLFIQPLQIDLGFVVNASRVPVEIWSSYTTPLSLTEIVSINDKGMVLLGAEPGDVLAPYGGHWNYELAVSLDVEMNIEAHFEWSFNGGVVTTELNVVGTRVALWPYPPIYPITEEWQWFTAVIETHSSEQRLSNANQPIQHLDYRYTLPVSVGAEQTARYAAQGKNPHVVPVWGDATPPVTVLSGATEIQVEATGRDFNNDGMVVLYKDAEHYEVAFIDRVTVTGLILQQPLLFDHFNVVVMPAITAIAPDGLKSVRRGARIEQQISWVNSQPLMIPEATQWPVEFVQEYLGRPVVIKRGKSGGVRDDMAFTWKDKTTASGQQMLMTGRDYGQHATTIEWVASGRESCWQLRQFLYQFKGRLNTCWWLTFHHEIRLAGSGSRKKIVAKPSGFNQFGGCHVYLQWQDGVQMTYARPDGVDADGNVILDIGGDPLIAVNMGDLVCGHVMRLMRPDDDLVKISYLPRHRMQVMMAMVEVSESELTKLES